MRVNIECFTGCKRIKQRRIISFVLGYLRMILWKISTAIGIKHRILATFNKTKSILTACMPLIIIKIYQAEQHIYFPRKSLHDWKNYCYMVRIAFYYRNKNNISLCVVGVLVQYHNSSTFQSNHIHPSPTLTQSVLLYVRFGSRFKFQWPICSCRLTVTWRVSLVDQELVTVFLVCSRCSIFSFMCSVL